MTFLEEYGQRLSEWSDVQYCMPRMHETALRYEQVTVLELGVRSGNSTSAFLAAAEANGGHVWSADTEPPDVPGHWRESGLWTFIQGDDLLLDFGGEKFDVVFIDTSHHYDHTLSELRRYVPMVAEGGTVLLHDTLLAHVDGERLPYPVTLAVGTFATETGLGWTEHGGPTGFAEIPLPERLTVERIPVEGWESYAGHLERYRWAAGKTKAGERVSDVACGIGYGATFFPHASIYHGYDKEGVPCHDEFPGVFHEVDLDAPAWAPEPCDVTCCFETLEHVADPGHTAKVLMGTTVRSIFVSVPVIPTTHCNEFHRTDFTREDVPLLFGGFVIEDEWPQPEETSHVWQFTRA